MHDDMPRAPSSAIVSGNIYFPQWRFAPPMDGIPAPTDAMFVVAMCAGLVMYLSLAVTVLSCGMLWHALGRCWNRLWRPAITAQLSLRSSR